MDLLPSSSGSYNSRLSITARQFFIPSLPQILLYMLISSLLLVLLSGPSIWKKFNENLQSNVTLGDVITGNAPFLQRVVDKLSHSRIPEIVFWLLVGCSIYIVIWFARNIINNIRNDVVADSYLHPVGYDRKMFWQSIFARKILLFSCMGLLLAYVIVGFKFLSVISKFFYSAIDGFSLSPSIVQIIGSVLAVAILIYLLILLFHLTVNLWRLVYRNL